MPYAHAKYMYGCNVISLLGCCRKTFRHSIHNGKQGVLPYPATLDSIVQSHQVPWSGSEEKSWNSILILTNVSHTT